MSMSIRTLIEVNFIPNPNQEETVSVYQFFYDWKDKDCMHTISSKFSALNTFLKPPCDFHRAQYNQKCFIINDDNLNTTQYVEPPP